MQGASQALVFLEDRYSGGSQPILDTLRGLNVEPLRVCTRIEAENALQNPTYQFELFFLLIPSAASPNLRLLHVCRIAQPRAACVAFVIPPLTPGLQSTLKGMRVRQIEVWPPDSAKVSHSILAIRGTQLPGPVADLVGRLGGKLIGRSPAFSDMLRDLAHAIPGKDHVLITGESGTGKELVAKAIHELGPCAAEPFVPFNVASLTESLFETEIFGHRKGAYTGAEGPHQGYLETARKGTIFFDEIGELRPHLQSVLLRVLETRKLQRVGDTNTIDVEARMVFATNRDLTRAVREGSFRGDLLARIKQIHIGLPPLRERDGDIELLARHFLPPGCSLSPDAMELLARYRFPLNVRELQAVIKQAALRAFERVIHPGDIDFFDTSEIPATLSESSAPDRRHDAEPAMVPETPTFTFAYPPGWQASAYEPLMDELKQAFSRDFLERRIRLQHTTAAELGKGLDLSPKTLRKYLDSAGLSVSRKSGPKKKKGAGAN